MSGASSQAQALEAAIETVEHYMKALRLAAAPKDKQTLDAKCKEWLTRAEEIKGTKDWRSAIPGDNGMAQPRPPVSTRKLATREEIILLEGAKLNGFIFLPWVGAPKPEEFQLADGRTLFLYVKKNHKLWMD